MLRCPASLCRPTASRRSSVHRTIGGGFTTTSRWSTAYSSWAGEEPRPHALEILADVSPGYRLAIADVDDASIAAVGATLGQIAAKSPKPVGIAGGFTGLLDGDVLEDWLALEAPGGWNE
jgi:hypothetical protein